MLTNDEIQHLYEEAFKERTTARDLEQRFARAVEAAVLAKLAAAEMSEPVAIRYDFDGHGWMYYDNGSSSNWFEIGMKKPNAEPLYTRNEK